MGAGAGSIGGRVVLAGMAILWWLGSSHAAAATALPGQTVHRLYSNVQLSVPVVTATTEESKHGSSNTTGLSAGRVAGIVVGCVGASVLLILLGLLLHCLCQRRKVSSNQEKPGSAFPPAGEDFSDTSFVLPELGGPNPHNKFDGMEWVDIKGMDDDVLVDISSDLRKYQHQHQRP